MFLDLWADALLSRSAGNAVSGLDRDTASEPGAPTDTNTESFSETFESIEREIFLLDKRNALTDLEHSNTDAQTEVQKTAPVSATTVSTSDTAEIDEAIAEVWKTRSPATIARLRRTLLGQHAAGSQGFESNVVPPATVEEIRLFGRHFADVFPHGALPLRPDRVQEWLYKARTLGYFYIPFHNHRIYSLVPIPREHISSGEVAVMKYLKHRVPVEYDRIQSIKVSLYGVPNPEETMVACPTLYWGKMKVEFQVSIPLEIYDNCNWEEVLEYVQHADTNEYRRVDELLGEWAERRLRHLAS